MDNSMYQKRIGSQLVDEEIRKNQLERKLANGEVAAFGEKYQGQFDRDLYGGVDKGIDKYNEEIIEEDELEANEVGDYSGLQRFEGDCEIVDILLQSIDDVKKKQINVKMRLKICDSEGEVVW